MESALRIVLLASDLTIADPADDYAIRPADGLRSRRIGLLENGFNLMAVLPADTFLTRRLSQLRPDMIIVDTERDARGALEHVVFATRRRPPAGRAVHT